MMSILRFIAVDESEKSRFKREEDRAEWGACWTGERKVCESLTELQSINYYYITMTYAYESCKSMRSIVDG